MSRVVSSVEAVLRGNANVARARNEMIELLDAASDAAQRHRVWSGIRLLTRYVQYCDHIASPKDLAVACRDFVLFNQQRLRISSALASLLAQVSDDCRIRVWDCSLDADITMPEWFPYGQFVERTYSLISAPKPNAAHGDGMLAKFTGFSSYRSGDQKMSAYTAVSLPDGCTMLCSLPTGACKSMVTQPAAVVPPEPSLTLVIVPTVALAIDQTRVAQRLFEQSVGSDAIDYYCSGQKSGHVTSIRERIRSRRLRILYLAPETLLKNEDMRQLIERAADEGYLRNLVIDEAHIVSEWGDLFRPDFQLLSAVRRVLLERTSGRLRTYLLSATLPNDSVAVLRDLFSEENRWIEYRGDMLRPEIQYCYVASPDADDRRRKVCQLMHLLPRPLILYVNSPDDCREWARHLQSVGFQRFELFNGETQTGERERIVADWNRGDTDLIIATSAFGLGVDKADVRTVVHACAPETANRLYQEVGRGGRDGLLSLSVVCLHVRCGSDHVCDDFSIVTDRVGKRVLTVQKILARWDCLSDPGNVEGEGDVYWLETGVSPSYIGTDRETGLHNHRWNAYVILLLARYGLLRVIDCASGPDLNSYHIKVVMTDPELMRDRVRFAARIEEIRQVERESANRGLRDIMEWMLDPRRRCWSELFARSYQYVRGGCAGCPNHGDPRHSRVRDFDHRLLGHIPVNDSLAGDGMSEKLCRIFGPFRDLRLTYDGFHSVDSCGLVYAVATLVKHGIHRFVLPSHLVNLWATTIDWAKQDVTLQTVFSSAEFRSLVNHGHDLLTQGTFCVVLAGGSDENARIYAYASRLLARHRTNRVIYVHPRGLVIESERKTLEDLTDGFSENLFDFVEGESDVS